MYVCMYVCLYIIQGGTARNIKQCWVVEGIVHVCMYVCMFVYHTRWHSKEYKAVLGGGGHCACMCMSYKVAQHSIAGWWRALCMYVYVIQGGTESSAGWWRALCMYVYVIQGGTESSAGWWRALCMYVYVIQGGTAQHCRVVEGIMHVCVCHTRWHSKEYKAVLGGGGHYACMCMSYKVAQQSSVGWWRALYVCM